MHPVLNRDKSDYAQKKATKAAKKPSLRPPIVTIMGHVDHGKTTLLDAIRQSNIVSQEHGGITQHIGAYQVKHQGKSITFIDTPGHAAFSEMRARGANVTDIVILVIAANDGVKPQTIESIKHIQAANVPLVVAINKIDLPGSSPDMVKAQLTEREVFCEGYGGQTPAIEISAIKKEGIDQLLEILLLLAEIEEITADPEGKLEAIVIESHLDKNRGPVATVVVKNGTLNQQDTVYQKDIPTKIRAMLNDLGKPISQATPGQPAQLTGFKTPPQVGSAIFAAPNQTLTSSPQDKPKSPDKDKKSKAASKKDKEKMDKKKAEEIKKAQEMLKKARKSTIKKGKKVKKGMEEEEKPEEEEPEERPHFNLILKADTAGTLEAIIQSALQDEITLVKSGVGPVGEADILMAQTTDAIIIGFNVPITKSTKTLARIEDINIFTFNIIYELIEFLEKKVLKLIEPTIDEVVTAEAKIAAIFDIKGDKIAGCQIKSGKVNRADKVHLVRNDSIIADAKVRSLKRGKEDIDTAKSGTECGIILKPSLDFKTGDMIKSYINKNE